MQKLLLVVALTVALLGAIGLGSAHELPTVHPVAATHTHLLASGGVSPMGPVCPGGGSGSCD